jgi:hypothetical protein
MIVPDALTCMQVYFEKQSDLELTLKIENYIKEYVSLVLLLFTTFTVTVGRILTNITAPSVSSLLIQSTGIEMKTV